MVPPDPGDQRNLRRLIEQAKQASRALRESLTHPHVSQADAAGHIRDLERAVHELEDAVAPLPSDPGLDQVIREDIQEAKDIIEAAEDTLLGP